jgi:predicted outer membrane repeat protein
VIDKACTGQYIAVFGYNNPASVPVTVTVGSDPNNKFNQTPQDRGQPTVFQPGRHNEVFEASFSSGNLVWSLTGKTTTAGTGSVLPCAEMEFSPATYSVHRSDGIATVTVNRSGKLVDSITSKVDYATSDGTATAGEDYVATNGTLEFAPGETTQTFDIILNDNCDNTETLTLTLSTPISGTLGTQSTAILTLEPSLSTNQVTRFDDGISVVGSLRYAVDKASDGDTIIFCNEGTHNVTDGQISLTKNLTITGRADPSLIKIDGNTNSRIFNVESGASVVIEGVTVQNGSAGSGGGIRNEGTLTLDNVVVSDNTATTGSGGGIWNWGSLTLDNVAVTDNTATTGSGGGIRSGAMLNMANSTVSNNTAGYGGGIWNQGPMTLDNVVVKNNTATTYGGGIGNQGTLTLDNVVVSDNTATTYGGGIGNQGTLSVANSTISGNNTVYGGGIWNQGPMTLDNVAVTNNTASDNGGGIYNFGVMGTATLDISNSTISDNISDANGGGICSLELMGTSAVDITNSTISGNDAKNGGGVQNSSGTLNITSSTIVSNTASQSGMLTGYGGGIQNSSFLGAGTTTIAQTIIAYNTGETGGPDCNGTFVSGNYNLLGDNSNCTFTSQGNDQVGDAVNPIDPRLGPLQDNGGDTHTHELYASSPAIDAIPAADCATTADQRGVARPQLSACDIGAFEYSIEGLIALYAFNEGADTTVYDTSGVAPAMDLTIDDADPPVNVDWRDSALDVTSETIVKSSGTDAQKIKTNLVGSGEFSVEAWITVFTKEQGGPARIITLSSDPTHRNFTLAHGDNGGGNSSKVVFRTRTGDGDQNGMDHPLETRDILQAGSWQPLRGVDMDDLTHIVYTYDGTTAKLYVDGVEEKSDTFAVDFGSWNDNYQFALANELNYSDSNDRPWTGLYHYVAIYSRALDATEVQKHFNTYR